MTTFTSRKAVREALATLFTSKGSWQVVFDHEPEKFDGKFPALTIRSHGTRQQMAGLNTNPVAFGFALRTWLLTSDPEDPESWSEADCEDALDDLDKDLRQVIRDNADSLSGCDYVTFDDAASTTGFAIVGGEGGLWRWEERIIWCHLSAGQ